jgi:hypothetical protein
LTAGVSSVRLGDVLALRDRVERQLGGLLDGLDDLDLRPVELLDRPLEVVRLANGEATLWPSASAGRPRGRCRSGRRPATSSRSSAEKRTGTAS